MLKCLTKFVFLISVSCLEISSVAGSTNIEKYTQDFVLKTKQIEIPGHPSAFNPSLVWWKGRLLMSFRELIDPATSRGLKEGSNGISHTNLVWLDDDFNPCRDTFCLTNNEAKLPCQAEDIRLFTIEDQLYAIYNYSGQWMSVAELQFDSEKGFSISWIQDLENFDGKATGKTEKNWVPFSVDGNLMFAYTIQPHTILLPLNNECKYIASTNTPIRWHWGELSGGTPALRLDDSRYLAFFHSKKEARSRHSHGEKALHYYMGAYTFSANPPYEILQVSPEPIVGSGFYNGNNYEPYWGPRSVVFPCGFVMSDEKVWISYGRQDREVWIAELDKQKLLDSLVDPQETKQPGERGNCCQKLLKFFGN